MKSAPAIGFEYRPSRWVTAVLVLLSVLAVIASMVSGLSWPAKLLLVSAVPIALFSAMHSQRTSISAVGWSPSSGWTLRSQNGADSPAVLLSSRVLGGFVMLRLASPGFGKVALWLGPDNTDADIRRRLRMRLAVIQSEMTQKLA